MKKLCKFDRYNYPYFLIQIRGCDDECYYIYRVDKYDINNFDLIRLFHNINYASKKADNYPCCPDIHLYIEWYNNNGYFTPIRELKSVKQYWNILYGRYYKK